MAESYFDQGLEQAAARIGKLVFSGLDRRWAVALRGDQDEAAAVAAITSLVSPTIQLMFESHRTCTTLVGRDASLLKHLLWAHGKVKSSVPAVPVPTAQAGDITLPDSDQISLTPKERARVVAGVVAESLDMAVVKAIAAADGASIARPGEPASTVASRSIVNRVRLGMRAQQVAIKHSDRSEPQVDTFFAANESGKRGRQITEREYFSLINSPDFDIDRLGRDEDGSLHILTKGSHHLVREPGGEVDDYEPDDGREGSDVWATLTPVQAKGDKGLADSVREMLSSRVAMRIPSSRPEETLGVIDLVTPSYITVRTDRGKMTLREGVLRAIRLTSGPAFALLPVSADILGSIQQDVEDVIQRAFVPESS